MKYCPFCGATLKTAKLDESTGTWTIDDGVHRAQLKIAGEKELTAGFTWLFAPTIRKVLCYTCYYYGRSRTGPICNFFGTYDPRVVECEAYKADKEA